MHQEHKNTINQNKLKQLKSPGLVASYDLWPANIVETKSEEKGSGGSQANNVHSATINKLIKSALHSGAHTGYI